LLGILFFIISILLSNLGSKPHVTRTGEFDSLEDTIPTTTQQNESKTEQITAPVAQPTQQNSTSDIPE
jgi:preprotein translocase subunit SecG